MPDPIYNAGPFRRWTEINFGQLEMTVVLSVDPSFIIPNQQINGATGAATGATNELKIERYRRLWTGQQSGAQVDGALLPILDAPVPPTSGFFAWWDESSLEDTNTASMLIVDHGGNPFILGETCK